MLIVAPLPFVGFVVVELLVAIAKFARKIRLVIVGIAVFGVTSDAFSDEPYRGSLRVTDGGKTLRVIHDHTRAHSREWYRSEMGVKEFSACNHTLSTQGILQVFRGSERLFCTAVPALTHIWLSPDEKYVVGLSDIVTNRFQLIVYSTEGNLVFGRAIDCEETKIEGCSRSVSQYVHWFHETHPGILLQEKDGGTLELSLNSRVKSRIRFLFPKKPETPLDKTPCGRNWETASDAEMYWYAYAGGHGRVERELGDVFCVSTQFGRDREYYAIAPPVLYGRSTKERVFLDYAQIAMDNLAESGATQQAVEANIPILKRITGQSFETKEEWVRWWERHRQRLHLSEDGQYLIGR